MTLGLPAKTICGVGATGLECFVDGVGGTLLSGGGGGGGGGGGAEGGAGLLGSSTCFAFFTFCRGGSVDVARGFTGFGSISCDLCRTCSAPPRCVNQKNMSSACALDVMPRWRRSKRGVSDAPPEHRSWRKVIYSSTGTAACIYLQQGEFFQTARYHHNVVQERLFLRYQ